MIQIDKNIPMPEPARPRGEMATAMRQMEIGDSFLIRVNPISAGLRSRITASARQAGIKITTRSADGGLRVWRTA